MKAGANMELKERDELSRIPALKTWFRTSRAVVMHLSNGTLQVKYFKVHEKYRHMRMISLVAPINFGVNIFLLTSD